MAAVTGNANECAGAFGGCGRGYFEWTRSRPKTRSATISRMFSVEPP